jgi:hypothetical protein
MTSSTPLELRAVYHRLEQRTVAHVQLCWLALLRIRVAENSVDDTSRNLRHELDRMQLVTLATPDGTVAQRADHAPAEGNLRKLNLTRAAALL